jgi:hypothetical protein
LIRNGENAVQGKPTIPEFHRGVVRVEPEDSNPVLSRRKIAGDFCDLMPRNKSLAIARRSRTNEDAILRNDCRLGRFQCYEEKRRTHTHRQNQDIKKYANDCEGKAALRRQR